MSATETVLFDRKVSKKKRTLSIAEKLLLHVPEEELPKGIEEPHLFAVFADIMESLKTELVFSVATVSEPSFRCNVKLVADTESWIGRKELLAEISTLLATKKVVWIDTDLMSFDWTDLNSMGTEVVLSKLADIPFREAHLSLQREDGRNDYVSYNVRE